MTKPFRNTKIKKKPSQQNSKQNSQPQQKDESQQEDKEGESKPSSESCFETGEPFKVKNLKLPKEEEIKQGSGRRSVSISRDKRGRYIKPGLPDGKTGDIAFDATVRAAAPYQIERRQKTEVRIRKGLIIEQEDIRKKIRKKRVGNLVLFVIDSSGSMGANQRMVAAKGAIFSLLIDSYQKRDRVGMVAFKQERAEVLLPPTNSVELASAKLKELPTGGKTPLSAGLQLGFDIIQRELRKDERLATLMVLITDGKANVSIEKGNNPLEEGKKIAYRIKQAGIKSLVIDTETGFVRIGKLPQFAEAMGGRYYHLEDIKAENIFSLVRDNL